MEVQKWKIISCWGTGRLPRGGDFELNLKDGDDLEILTKEFPSKVNILNQSFEEGGEGELRWAKPYFALILNMNSAWYLSFPFLVPM